MSAEREKHRDLSLTSWTLADVYGRPRMAPRAGFEIACKDMMYKQSVIAETENTPSDTPRMSGCFVNTGGPFDRLSRHHQSRS